MRLLKNSAISQEIIDGEVFLFNQEKEILVSLNESASDIWNLIEGIEEGDLLKKFLDLYCFKDEGEKIAAIEDFGAIVTKLKESGCLIYQE